MACTFCAIPGFKGPQRSKAPADIVAEIRQLVDGGVREVILVSQNTTAYGQDFSRDPSPHGSPPRSLHGTTLARLLEQICAGVPELPWLRFHYCYPGWVNDDLLCTMARLPQVVQYLDIPLQHADPAILRAMNRPSDVKHVEQVLARARELMPEIALRTTFIAGFPGEKEAHFQSVLRLMRAVRFDHVGIFPYFPEEGTPAATMPGQVTDRTKQARQRRALELQQEISLERNRSFIGRVVEVLVEGRAGHSMAPDGQLVGRTYRDAPEVDGLVVFRGPAARGDLVPVQIGGAGPYDLFGEQQGVVVEQPMAGEVGLPAATARSRTIGIKALPMLQPR